jgi:enamine deaminase RidA (YjgF/YER057c/UK114 family)
MMSLRFDSKSVPLCQHPIVEPGRLISFSIVPGFGEPIPEFCRRFAALILERSLHPVHLLAFGDCRANGAVVAHLQRNFESVDWPITWVEGRGCGSQPIAGLQAHAFTGEVDPIRLHGRVVGSQFLDGGARQCIVGGLMSATPAHSRARQTTDVLEELQMALGAAGFGLPDVVRTWFFLDHILDWYDEFNRARTKIYAGTRFRAGSMPASTGVGAGNPAGAAVALAAWAFRPLEKNSYAEEVASPLQCPAPAYGSSFSRALETSANGGRRLFISGTASIEPGGKTCWVGDVRRQIARTMEVVEAMASSRGFGLSDFVRATAYFRNAADAGAFAEWHELRGLCLPVVSAQCDVCRDDLLFELEAEAEASSVLA